MIHARVDAGLDGSGDFVLVDVRPSVGNAVDPVQPAHRPAAEADLRHFEVGSSQLAIFHVHGVFVRTGRSLYLCRFSSITCLEAIGLSGFLIWGAASE